MSEEAIKRAANEAAPGAQIVRNDGDLLVYYSGFNLSKFVRFLALQPVVVAQREPSDSGNYLPSEIAKRMWQTFTATGDRWFKYAALRLEQLPDHPAERASDYDEVEALRHDLDRYMAIAQELTDENERLRSRSPAESGHREAVVAAFDGSRRHIPFPPTPAAKAETLIGGTGFCGHAMMESICPKCSSRPATSPAAMEGEKDAIVNLIHKHVGIRQRINVDLTGVEEAADAILALRSQPVTVNDPLKILEENCWDLRCIDIPTGGGDADIGWNVIEHHMASPKERIVGSGASPIEAIRSVNLPSTEGKDA
jgi:hypothetical protein